MNSERLRYAGNPNQLYGVREALIDGKRVIEVDTGGGLCFDVNADGCLDILRLKDKGVNISYLSKNGLNRGFEQDFSHSFPGGMLYTCGLFNAGDANHDGGVYHPMHGRIHAAPAEETGAFYDEQEDALIIRGVMRESVLFGHSLILRRTITAPVGKRMLRIDDTIENHTPEAAEYMLTYHINFGYPFLDSCLQLILPEGTKTTPENQWAGEGLAHCRSFSKPIDGEEEQVYFHELPAKDKRMRASLVQPALGVKATLEASIDTLPFLIEWKSMRSSDYALGLEPSNNLVMGRERERRNGTLRTLAPFGSVQTVVSLTFEDL